jgi:hypothetical protein
MKTLRNEEIHGVGSSINKLLFFLCRNSLLSHRPFHCGGESHYSEQFKDFELRRECGTHFRKEMHTEICFGNLKLRDYSGDLNIDGKIKLQFILKKYV